MESNLLNNHRQSSRRPGQVVYYYYLRLRVALQDPSPFLPQSGGTFRRFPYTTQIEPVHGKLMGIVNGYGANAFIIIIIIWNAYAPITQSSQ